jgi:predicted transcriptional regulator
MARKHPPAGSENPDALERALGALGPLEARVMREAWTGGVAEPFVVRDMRQRMPSLAYTTVMTTLNRLAEKRLLEAERMGRQRPTRYRVRWTPGAFLAEASRSGAEEFIQRYGDAALAAFAARLDALTPEQRGRLKRLAEEQP